MSLINESKMVMLPGEDYSRVKDGEVTMFIIPSSQRIDCRVYDMIPVLFKDNPSNALVEILGMETLLFSNITDNIAMKCGFNNKSDLKHSLLEEYPTLDNGSMLVSYEFMIAGISEKVGE